VNNRVKGSLKKGRTKICTCCGKNKKIAEEYSAIKKYV
jgi:hypothetical protein